MNKAKEAVSEFLHKGNHHDATIEQTTNAPVVHEQVQKHKTEHTTTALDREVHEHHHQTSVQPIADREVLPEKHSHNIMPVEHKTHHHGKDAEVERKLQEQAAQFHDKSTTLETQHHRGETTAMGGEHHHLHVHENVQPLIQKETIQPHIVHNVIPVHERIDKEPTVHKTTVNPTMTMEEFKHAGGHHTGTHKEHHEYTGDPLKVDPNANVSIGKHHLGDREIGGYPDDRQGGIGSQQQSTLPGTTGTSGGLTGGTTGHHHHHDHQSGTTGMGTTGTTGTTGAGPHNSSMANKMDPRVDSDLDGSRGVGNTGTGSGLTGSHNTTGTGTGLSGNTTGTSRGGPMIDSDVNSEPGYNKEKKTGLGGLMDKITGK